MQSTESQRCVVRWKDDDGFDLSKGQGTSVHGANRGNRARLRYMVRAGTTFIDAEVTSDQVRQYLVDTNTYGQFIELIQDHLEETLPVLGRRQAAKCGAKRQAHTCPVTTPQQ